MGFAVAFDLGDFIMRFPSGTQLYIVFVDPTAMIGFIRRKQPAVGKITVMSKSEGTATRF
jgi:hypothetical protein